MCKSKPISRRGTHCNIQQLSVCQLNAKTSGRMRGCSLTPHSNSCETDINRCDRFNVTCSIKRDSHYVKVIVNHIKHIKLALNICWHTLANIVWPRSGSESYKPTAESALLLSLSLSRVISGLMCNIKDTIFLCPLCPFLTWTLVHLRHVFLPIASFVLFSVWRLERSWQGQRERRVTWRDGEICADTNSLLVFFS